MTNQTQKAVISVMLAVTDAPTAVDWYIKALDATVLWSLGSVVGLEVAGAPVFVHQQVKNTFDSPLNLGTTTARIEMFVDDPDDVVARALRAGATGSLDDIQDYEAPWGKHRQGGFTDPFGHVWLVGDKSPLSRITPT